MNIYEGTMFLIGLFITLAIGYELGKSYDVDGFSIAIVTLAATFILFGIFEFLNSIFIDSYINIGGIGITISLILAIIFASRSKFNKAVTKATILPVLFNVNEPFLFGLPLILNSIYIILFVIAPMPSATLAYLMSTLGFLGSSTVIVRLSTPPIIRQ